MNFDPLNNPGGLTAPQHQLRPERSCLLLVLGTQGTPVYAVSGKDQLPEFPRQALGKSQRRWLSTLTPRVRLR